MSNCHQASSLVQVVQMDDWMMNGSLKGGWRLATVLGGDGRWVDEGVTSKQAGSGGRESEKIDLSRGEESRKETLRGKAGSEKVVECV